MARKLLGVVIAVLSAGWLWPLWRAVDSFLYFWEVHGVTMLMNQVPNPLSGAGAGPAFFIMQTRSYAAIAISWFALVVFGWACFGVSRLFRRTLNA
jgi:hypothetical protein